LSIWDGGLWGLGAGRPCLLIIRSQLLASADGLSLFVDLAENKGLRLSDVGRWRREKGKRRRGRLREDIVWVACCRL